MRDIKYQKFGLRKAKLLLVATGLAILACTAVVSLSVTNFMNGSEINTSPPRAAVTPIPRLWNRTWGGTGFEMGYSVWGDGTRIYTAGSTNSFGAGNFDFALIAWDPATGAKMWNTTWGGPADDYGYSTWGDGTRVYIAGYTESYGQGSSDFALVAWDPATGVKLWNTTWGGTGNDLGHSVWGDGTRVYTTGSTGSFGAGGFDMALVAWDPATGAKLWDATWGGPGGDYCESVWGDGTRIYAAGYTNSYGVGGFDMALVAWDPATGAKLWDATWGGVMDDQGNSVWGDGSRVFTAGSTQSFGAGTWDMALVAWDPATGAKQWNTTWGGTKPDQAYSVWGDGTRVYMVGSTSSFGDTFDDLALVAWDPATGAFLQTTSWGWTGYDIGFSVWGDGSRIFTAGNTDSFGAGGSDVALVAWDVHFSISHPSDFSYTASTTGQSISWIVSCATAPSGNYVVYRDGVAITSGTWISGQGITVSANNLALGVHTFTLVALDGFGKQVEDSIDVAVISADPTPESWGVAETLQAVTIIMLGFVVAAVLVSVRKNSHGEPARQL